MNKRDLIYSEIKNIAEKHKINLSSLYYSPGRGVDCGELCIEYTDEEGYILFAYDRGLETYHFSTKDVEEFKYVAFEHLCSQNGFKYELSHRRKKGCLSFFHKNNNLKSDTRKIAFEYALYLLNEINPVWMEKSILKYEELLNNRYTNKNVFFDKHKMKFNVK